MIFEGLELLSRYTETQRGSTVVINDSSCASTILKQVHFTLFTAHTSIHCAASCDSCLVAGQKTKKATSCAVIRLQRPQRRNPSYIAGQDSAARDI
eukprot:5135280-Amphidinium_carterae.1